MREKGKDASEQKEYSFGALLERERKLREDMRRQGAWDAFASTGKIGDYLKYCGEKESDHEKYF